MSLWDRIVTVRTTSSLVTLLAVAIALTICTIHQTQRPTLLKLLILVLVEDEDSRRLRHVVDARDRRGRGGR